MVQTMDHFFRMKISVSDAKAQLTDLIRRAEAGEEVVLTRHGQPTVRLTPVAKRSLDPTARRAVLESLSLRASDKALPGPDAARSQDFLYDDGGLPG